MTHLGCNQVARVVISAVNGSKYSNRLTAGHYPGNLKRRIVAVMSAQSGVSSRAADHSDQTYEVDVKVEEEAAAKKRLCSYLLGDIRYVSLSQRALALRMRCGSSYKSPRSEAMPHWYHIHSCKQHACIF